MSFLAAKAKSFNLGFLPNTYNISTGCCLGFFRGRPPNLSYLLSVGR